jgi:hypothetical protein
MRRKIIICISIVTVSAGLFYLSAYWLNTQPVAVIDKSPEGEALVILPARNREIVRFIESNGKSLAPDYQTVVCTEFVIKVIEEFSPLTSDEKKDVRIITTGKLDELVRGESPLIKGVQSALSKRGKGEVVDRVDEVLPGDFVQFWNIYQGEVYGHCGIVMAIDPDQSITCIRPIRLPTVMESKNIYGLIRLTLFD